MLFLSSAEYLNTCANWSKDPKLNLISTLITEPSKIDRIKKFTYDVMQSFDYSNGIFHLEAFYDDRSKSLTFLEISPRFGGAYIVSMNRQFFGINLVREGILSLLNSPSDVTEPMGYMASNFNHNKSVIAVLIGRTPDKPKKIKNLVFPSLPSNTKFLYQPRIGEFTRDRTTSKGVLEVICECGSNDVEQIVELLNNNVKIEYE